MKINTHSVIGMAALLSLAACAETPMGPSVQILPPPGKDYTVFQQEQQFCQSQAAQAVNGQAEHQNHKAIYGALAATALGAGLGAAAGGGAGAGIGAAAGALGGGAGGSYYSQSQQGGLQTQYDNAYVQCMIAYHNVLPGYNNPVAQSASQSGVRHKAVHRASKAQPHTEAAQPAATTEKKSAAPIELD
ncbi:MAG: glycine zipper family protein [Acetobacter orientalis]|uniref:glycine zipper family protein n=1 Tax=Acetobacter orientalis TaxID=146474 RepID=UPI0039E96DB9